MVGSTLVLPTASNDARLLHIIVDASRAPVSLARVMEYQQDEQCLFWLGVVAAACMGSVFPVYAVILTEMIVVYYNPVDSELESGVQDYALGFAGLAVAAMIFDWTKVYCFDYVGSRLTTRLRAATMVAVMEQDISFFDREENSSGRLVARLAMDAALVRGTSGERLGTQMQTAFTLIAGLIIAFTATWRLTLVIIGVVPLVMITGALQMKATMGLEQAGRDGVEAATQVATEAMSAIRIVKSFRLQGFIQKLFEQKLEGQSAIGWQRGLAGGLAIGASQLVIFCFYALAFWTGA